MICNKEMKYLIEKLNNKDELTTNIELIEFSKLLFPKFNELSNAYNEKYYLLDNNFITKKSGTKLSWLEWDINEKYISNDENDSILKVTKIGLIVVKVWSNILKTKYPNKFFDIVLSIDKGDLDCSPSATLRFYLVREDFHCAEDIEKFGQPVLIESTQILI